MKIVSFHDVYIINGKSDLWFLAAPASPPDNVTALASSSTSFTVTWDVVPPIDQNGIITIYEVQYEPLETFGGQIQTETRNFFAPVMSATVTDLEEFVYYNISVRAYTSAGEGPYSMVVMEITFADCKCS